MSVATDAAATWAEREAIDCTLCGVASDHVAVVENGYTGRRCPDCGLIYISPRPTRAAIAQMYAADQVRLSADDLIAEAFVKRLYARHHLRIIRRYLRGGRLLEVGAGAGFFLDEARRAGFAVVGIEPNRAQAAFIRDQLGIVCDEAPLSPASFGGQQFDLIYLCNVLGHLYDPLAEFTALHERLKDGGLLVFETGNLADVASRYFALYETLDYPDHLFLFGEQSLRRLLEQSGFVPVQFYHYNILPQLMIARLRRVLGARLRRWLGARQTAASVNPTAPQAPDAAAPREAGFSLRYLLSYLVRYRLGALLPKEGRPQTVLVFARKQG